MMQTSGLGSTVDAAVEAALAESERTIYARILVDWNRNGSFSGMTICDLSEGADSIKTDRALAGSAPPEVMLIEGSAAASLEFDVSGQYLHSNGSLMNFASVFSPYNGLSPLYNKDPIGCEIKYALGVETIYGVIWYDQFIGRIRSITPHRGGNAVTITALDRAEELRVPVTFPKWAISKYHMDRGWTLAQLCESHWVIDHCLRHGNTSPTGYRWQTDREKYPYVNDPEWLAADPGSQLWISGNGSYLPNIGQLDNNRSQGFPKTETVGKPIMSKTGALHPSVATETSRRPYSFNGVRGDASGEAPDGPYSANENRYWAKDRHNFEYDNTHYFGFTISNVVDPASGYDVSYPWTTTNWTPLEIHTGYESRIKVVVHTGSIRLEARNWVTDSGAVTPWYPLPTGTDHIKVDVIKQDEADSVIFNLFLNGVKVTPTDGYDTNWDIWDNWVGGGANYDTLKGLVVLRRKGSMGDIYWSYRNTGFGDTPVESWIRTDGTRQARYAAVLDRGLNRLTNIPVEMYEDAWQAITDVAAAELGAAFWDEKGVFRFWNRNTLLELQNTITGTINLDNASDLQITNSLDSIRNVLTADSKMVTADRDVVFEATNIDEFYIPPNPEGGFVQFTIYRDDISQVTAWKMDRRDTVAGASPNWDDKETLINGAYVVQWLIGGLWTERSDFVSGVDVNARLDVDGNLVIRVWNGYEYPARFGTGVNEDGSPALRIMGTLMTPQPNAIQTVFDRASVLKYGERNLPLSGDWVQWQPEIVGSTLLSSLLPRTIQPIPTTENIQVAGDPRRQLGDTVRLQDPDGLGEEMKLQIYGITRTFSQTGGLQDTLSVELIKPALIGYWDSPQYGLWDTSFIWSA
jgi:hypothetical protein